MHASRCGHLDCERQVVCDSVHQLICSSSEIVCIMFLMKNTWRELSPEMCQRGWCNSKARQTWLPTIGTSYSAHPYNYTISTTGNAPLQLLHCNLLLLAAARAAKQRCQGLSK
jgi:hypothetical protein